ncbi:MAG: glycoside hydrolase family 3 protein [Maribacter sp.]|nr:glycoside hydrolase family 3 protein [Maribacter sp.]
MNRLLEYREAKTGLSKREKIGQLFMPAAFINDSEEEIQALERLISEQCVGGLCFFHSRVSAATNYEGKKEITYNEQSFKTLQNLVGRYQQKTKHRLLIAIDAEWGLAMRIENTPQYPYAITLGALRDGTDLVFQVGKNIAHDCKQAGVHYNLAPVSDINNNPNNPVIGYRSFGGDKINVYEKSLAYIKGMQSEGIICSIKHFPGHGDTAVDSHLGLPIIEKSKKEMLSNELFPFKELIKENVDSIMVGHLSVPALTKDQQISSSISKDIINGLLRNELGFNGVVISDALNMHAVSKNYTVKGELEWLAFDAGNDVLCFAEHISEGIETILSNADDTQIEEAFERVWKLKEKAFKAEVEYPKELSKPHFLNEKIAKDCITLCKGNESNIAALRDEGFLSISNMQSTDNLFVRYLNRHCNFRSITVSESSNKTTKSSIVGEENILLSLFPPQVKPTDNFGFTLTEIKLINELIRTKNVALYLFGNPYAIRLFEYQNAKAVVLAYQDFKAFQEVAAEHFLGNLVANGKLPVVL